MVVTVLAPDMDDILDIASITSVYITGGDQKEDILETVRQIHNSIMICKVMSDTPGFCGRLAFIVTGNTGGLVVQSAWLQKERRYDIWELRGLLPEGRELF